MKVNEVQGWFFDHVTLNGKPYLLDDEQAAIVLDEHKNAIVTARAGSGKTHTLIAKIVYLIAVKSVDPSKILALGFNRDPQEDFQRRLQSVRVDGKPVCDKELALTFHSFAKKFEEGNKNPLCDDGKKGVMDRSVYIRAILDKVVDPKNIYDFVRDDSHEPNPEDFSNEKDYYSAIKYARFETLGGKDVKSRGEKIIADYLFEHGIEYEYEPISFYPKKLSKYANIADKERLEEYEKIITPDFRIVDDYGQYVIWEHWGISGDETADEIAEIDRIGVIGKYSEYSRKKDFKEWFYSGEWLDESLIDSEEAKSDKKLQQFLNHREIIYTNFKKNESREDFEEKIKEKLAEKDVFNEKLDDDELIERFKNVINNVQTTAERVTQFIDRAEQQFPGDYKRLENECKKTKDEQVKKFYKVCLKTYDYYLKDLCGNPNTENRLIDELFPDKLYRTDFNILMDEAAKNIDNGMCGKKVDIDKLEYIFLDEYQDFSYLFLKLIESICARNCNVKILAVGDDWQAINSYAGASLEYFYNFEKYFPEDVVKMRIATNRRSVDTIVDAANNFMKNSLNDDSGSVAEKVDKNKEETINECVMSDVRNFVKNDGTYMEDNAWSKYGLMLAEILKDNPGKSIRFLNRTKDFKISDNYKEKLTKFETLFRGRYEKYLQGTNFDNDVKFATVNTSKGLEADVVIILESDIGRFPIFHPDNYLYAVFGDTEQKALDEQKRLFYVALTRAKEKIYIIHKKDLINLKEQNPEVRDSDFLRMMEIEKYNHYKKESFLSLEAKIKKREQLYTEFYATEIRFSPDKIHKGNIAITVYSRGHELVRQFNAVPEYASVSQLKKIKDECSEQNPKKLRARATPLGKYPNNKQYISLFDATR